MYKHSKLGRNSFERSRALWALIRSGSVTLGGYQKGKIYGLLNCSSGKRMKTENRMFFFNEAEALAHGYRPCGNCMPVKYKIWKASQTGYDKDAE